MAMTSKILVAGAVWAWLLGSGPTAAQEDEPATRPDLRAPVLRQIEPAAPVVEAPALRLQRPLSGDTAWLDNPLTGPANEVAFVFPGLSEPETVDYQVLDGYAVHEGDIVLGPVSELLATPEVGPRDGGGLATRESPLTAMNNERFYWPDGVIFYSIAEDMPQALQETVRDGIARITAVTDLVILPRNGQRNYVYLNYVGNGCRAEIGRRGGRQMMWLDDECGPGTVAHEFLHTAGFRHEQSRPDRNDYVRILHDNIRRGQGHNFRRSRHALGLGPYDFNSLMHYPETAFGRRRSDGTERVTIQSRVPGVTLGPTGHLSAGDISGIAETYGRRICYPVQASRLTLEDRPGRGWSVIARVVPGVSTVLHAFGGGPVGRERAREYMRVLREGSVDQVCSLRLNAFDGPKLHFSGGQVMRGTFESQRCTRFDPRTVAPQPHNGGWRLVSTRPRDGRMVTTGLGQYPEETDAYRAWAHVLEHQPSRICYIGSGADALAYWRA